MLPPKQTPPVCCENHIRRYMPIGETAAERMAVAAALARWEEEFWLHEGWELEELPPFVSRLLPSPSRVR